MLFLCFDFGKTENRCVAVTDESRIGTIIAGNKTSAQTERLGRTMDVNNEHGRLIEDRKALALARRVARENVVRYSLTSRTQFQALKSGSDTQTDLPLQAQRLQRDRIVRPTDQHVTAGADADRRTALRTSVITR